MTKEVKKRKREREQEQVTPPPSPEDQKKFIETVSRSLFEAVQDNGDDNVAMISKTIEKMKEESRTSGEMSVLPHYLAIAYCLRALLHHERAPQTEFKDFMQDTKTALEHWSSFSISTLRINCLISNPLSLVFEISDILAVKGLTTFDKQIGKLVTTFLDWEGLTLQEQVRILWGSKSFHHGFCVSPLDMTFLESFPEASVRSLESIDFWEECLHDSVLLRCDFQQKLIDYSSKSDKIDEAWRTVSELMETRDYSDDKSKFFGGSLYLTLSQRLREGGRLHEAIICALEATTLHSKLYDKHFTEYDNVIEKKQTIASIFSRKKVKEDLDAYYVRPWRVVQGLLQSKLHLASLLEEIGDKRGAGVITLEGEKPSKIFHLPIFEVAFSTAQGKVFHEQGEFKKSVKMLNIVKEILQSHTYLGCAKCKVLLRVSAQLAAGEKIWIDRSIYSDWDKEIKRLDEKLGLGSGKQNKSCICNNNQGCYICLCKQVKDDRVLSHAITMRWEVARRRSLVRIGPKGSSNLSTLVSRSSILLTIPFNMITAKFYQRTFAIELADILYDMSCENLQSESSIENKLTEVLSWLRQAFVLCREVPSLLQKVSRLLSTLYILSTSINHLSLSCCTNKLQASHWASYFHQASIGTAFHFNLVLRQYMKKEPHHVQSDSTSDMKKIYNLHKAPSMIEELDSCVYNFFQERPRQLVICLAMIGDPVASLLREVMKYPNPIHAWLLLSRWNSNNQPIVALLPICSLFERYEQIFEIKSSEWECGWGTSVIDKVAPAFRGLMEESYYAPISLDGGDKEQQLKKLNKQFAKFLRNFEKECFGPWKILLEKEQLCSPTQESVSTELTIDGLSNKLSEDLKYHCNFSIDTTILKILIVNGRGLNLATLLRQSKHGCIIGDPYGVKVDDTDAISISVAESLLKKTQKEARKLKGDVGLKCVVQPPILVLDLEIQMLPWEKLPKMITQEVYRLPTVHSISWILSKNSERQAMGMDDSVCLSVDVSNAYYVLDPDSDSQSILAYYKNQLEPSSKFQGIYGRTPSAKEFAYLFEKRDITWYFGHGDGFDYWEQDNISGLSRCGACFLLGCNSVLQTYNGSYRPTGNLISLIIAGSPFVVGSLWQLIGPQMCYFHTAIANGHTNDSSDRVGSLVSKSRDTFRFKYLHGACFVCYGVPTRMVAKGEK